MTLLATVAAALAVLVVTPGRPRTGRPVPVATGAGAPDVGLLRRGRPLWALLAAAAGATLAPVPWTWPAAAAAATTVWVVATRSEPPEQRRRREAAARELPHLVELVSAGLGAGSSGPAALALACRALPGAAADELAPSLSALRLGTPPAQVWLRLAGHGVLGPLGRTLGRAEEAGAPVAEAVRALADELAAEDRLAVEDRARSVGVRAALPLGLCLLPGFLLLGIVPLVAAAVGELGW